MSNSISNGLSVDIPVQATHSLKLAWLGGTYTAKIISGAANLPVALATNSASDQKFGPYATAIMVRLTVSAIGRVAWDTASAPAFIPPGEQFTRQDDGIPVTLSGVGPAAAFAVDGDGNSGPAPIPVSAVSVYPCDSTQADIAKAPTDLAGIDPMSLGAGVTAAEVWANAGYATTKAAVGGVIFTSRRPSFATDMIIGSFVFNIPATTPLAFFAGSADFGAAFTGIQIGAQNNNLQVYACAGGVASGQLQHAAPLIANSADHHCLFAYEPARKALYLWIDGLICVATQGAVNASAGQWTNGMTFGNCRIATGTATAGKFKNIQLLYQTGGTLPVNLNAAAVALTAAPATDLLAHLKPADGVDVYIAGQSNQSGQGVTPGANTGLGTPIRDRTLPMGQAGKRSFYPTAANELGLLGYSLQVYNHAWGGSGLRDSWVGFLADWQSGEIVKRGSYRINAGNIYKCAYANQTAGPTSTTAPAEGTGADSIPWTLVGAYAGQRMGVQQPDDALFDPNGNISAMNASIAVSTGKYKIAYVAFGETDASMSVSRAQYADALVQITTSLMASGKLTKVMIGHTFGTPSLYTYYDSTLIPAIGDVIASLGGKAVAGANMRAAFGVAVITPASGIGLVDVFHGNDALYDAGGRVLGRAFAAALT